MSCILHIETSTSACSVAISNEGENVFEQKDLKGPSHNVSLGVFVDEAISFADSHAMPLDAVAVSCGPGSYTGLRIGVSMAKGICYGRDLKLIGLPTLEVLCVPVLLRHELPEDALLCPMIDARRMEVYTAVFDQYRQITETSPMIIDENSFAEQLAEGPCLFIGDGAGKCADVIRHPNAHFCQCWPKASAMLAPALAAYKEKRFEDVAYFEPFYLKEFVATVSRKKLF